jgi:hypothetical protein
MHRNIDAAMIEGLVGLVRQTYQLAPGPASKNWQERWRRRAAVMRAGRAGEPSACDWPSRFGGFRYNKSDWPVFPI